MGLSTSDHFILYRPDKDTVEGISKSLTNRLGISTDDILRKMQSHSNLSMGEKLIFILENICEFSNGNFFALLLTWTQSA